MKTKTSAKERLLASLDQQLREAEAMAARGEKPYVPDILFTSGVFKDREEWDLLTENAVVEPYNEGKIRRPKAKRA